MYYMGKELTKVKPDNEAALAYFLIFFFFVNKGVN